MGRIQHTAVYGILHLTGLDHRVDGQEVDFQVFAGHGVNPVDVGLGVLQENTATPGSLHLQDRGFGMRDHRETGSDCAGGAHGTRLQELAAAGFGLGRYVITNVFLRHFNSSLQD
jgi:hypothetical protein